MKKDFKNQIIKQMVSKSDAWLGSDFKKAIFLKLEIYGANYTGATLM